MPSSVEHDLGSVHTRMMTFDEWRALREGLWLADKNAMPGMSRISPFPTTQAHLKKIRGKPLKPAKPIKTSAIAVPDSRLLARPTTFSLGSVPAQTPAIRAKPVPLA